MDKKELAEVTNIKVKDLTEGVEKCDFRCAGGPLRDSVAWVDLKSKTELWIVVKGGANIMHTAGKKGWRFTACTNEEEAQWLADMYNKERYGGNIVCTVERY